MRRVTIDLREPQPVQSADAECETSIGSIVYRIKDVGSNRGIICYVDLPLIQDVLSFVKSDGTLGVDGVYNRELEGGKCVTFLTQHRDLVAEFAEYRRDNTNLEQNLMKFLKLMKLGAVPGERGLGWESGATVVTMAQTGSGITESTSILASQNQELQPQECIDLIQGPQPPEGTANDDQPHGGAANDDQPHQGEAKDDQPHQGGVDGQPAGGIRDSAGVNSAGMDLGHTGGLTADFKARQEEQQAANAKAAEAKAMREDQAEFKKIMDSIEVGFANKLSDWEANHPSEKCVQDLLYQGDAKYSKVLEVEHCLGEHIGGYPECMPKFSSRYRDQRWYCSDHAMNKASLSATFGGISANSINP